MLQPQAAFNRIQPSDLDSTQRDWLDHLLFFFFVHSLFTCRSLPPHSSISVLPLSCCCTCVPGVLLSFVVDFCRRRCPLNGGCTALRRVPCLSLRLDPLAAVHQTTRRDQTRRDETTRPVAHSRHSPNAHTNRAIRDDANEEESRWGTASRGSDSSGQAAARRLFPRRSPCLRWAVVADRFTHHHNRVDHV